MAISTEERLADTPPVIRHFFFRMRIQRIDLKSNRRGEIFVRDAGQRNLPHRHFIPGQQNGGRQMSHAQLLQKAGVRGAPIGGRLFPKTRDGELTQHSDAVGTQTRTTVTVRSCDPISIPMPVPMASHFAKSMVVMKNACH